jgi:lipoate-protein ligase A
LTDSPLALRRVVGNAAVLHGDRPATQFECRWYDVDRPALVLGSTQPDTVDRTVAESLEVDVIRRHSGGSAVLLVPGEFVWVDVVVPRGHPLWHDDVGLAMVWLGELWRTALQPWAQELTVHRGPMVRSPLSATVCFAGAASGEVLGRAGKVVGISQRRTRQWTRLQSTVHLVWRPDWYGRLLPSSAELGDLHAIAQAVPAAAGDVAARFAAALDAALDGSA